MSETTLTIRADEPIGTISPRLYGHFAEHLGRCCYDGIWVGNQRGTTILHENGFRSDVLHALRALPVPLLRWPGGCYADHYHWRDGIGPTTQRPIRLGMSCGLQVEDDNSLGTHEFLWYCAQIGAEPYLAGNVGSGAPQELCDWVEYCNSAVATTLARQRATNGAPQPFGVKLWGVGNENWGCGGNYDPVTYAHEYRQYATMLRHVDPTIELVACGLEEPRLFVEGFDIEWNAKLLDTLGRHITLVDHLSIHTYWVRGGPETEFNESEYYALLAEAQEMEQNVRRTARTIRDAISDQSTKTTELGVGESEAELVYESGPRRDRRRIGIALDEWGVWHPEAREWGPGEVPRRSPVTYEQANTMRDAVATAIALEGFHRQCNVLSLANLAQIVNVLQAPIMTDGLRMLLTPTYHVLRLHAPHIGATALSVGIENGPSLPDGSPTVSATASRTDGRLTVTLTNRHFDRGISVRVASGIAGQASGQLLTADSPRAVNSFEHPEAVAPVALEVSSDGPNGLHVDLPPHSVATIVLQPD